MPLTRLPDQVCLVKCVILTLDKGVVEAAHQELIALDLWRFSMDQAAASPLALILQACG